jgi:hypothetical protein
MLRTPSSAADNAASVQAILDKFKSVSDTISSDILPKYPGTGMAPYFQGTSGVNKPRLARYYTVTNAPTKKEDIVALMKELRGHNDVQTAYVTPETSLPSPIHVVRASANAANSTVQNGEDLRISPDFSTAQGHFLPSNQGGLDILYSMTQPGGLGDGVQVFDIEYSWFKAHEDLLVNFPYIIGAPNTFPPFHGTAVAGVVGGDFNTFGVTGIVPNSKFIGSTVLIPGDNGPLQPVDRSSAAIAIVGAMDRAQPGDVILLEQQRPWTAEGVTPRFIAIEWWPEDFDAIKGATDAGLVVVEAAGNGFENSFDGQNFDDPTFIASRNRPPQPDPNDFDTFTFDTATHPNPFDPANPSSGAVLVGAGVGGFGGRSSSGPDRSRLDYSGYGRRVDVQAWGENIVTTGYPTDSPRDCNLGPILPPPDLNQCYTSNFGGTSGASAIIAGVVASVQGVLKMSGRRPLTSNQFIQLFRDPATGDAQADGPNHPQTQRIGSRPVMSRLIPRAIQISSPA